MNADEPRVMAAAVYPFRAASTRLRLGLLPGPLEQRGISFKTWTYLDNAELDSWVGGRRLAPAAQGLARIPALLRDLRSASALVVQRECLPWNSLLIEAAARRRAPVIWDVDDAMWLSTVGIRGLIRGNDAKYTKLAGIAAEVWAGSETVASWCMAQGAKRVRVVPTVTTLPESISEPDNPPRLVWVGTPSSVVYLNQMLAANQEVLKEWTLEVVGAVPRAFPGLQIESFPWTQANENRALSRAWAGLYPIDTAHEFSVGKSALKAVLMGAYGLPVIATRTPSIAAVINHGETGLLVSGTHGWGDALKAMSDRSVRDRMGLAARSRVEVAYNPSTWSAELSDALARYVH